MFVRWKRRKSRNRRTVYGGTVVEIVSTKGDSLDAVVAENYREGKRVRQRVLCHLGVVHEKTARETRDRVLFWERATLKLDRLTLPKKARAQIENKLSEVIPVVSKRESKQYEAQASKRLRQIMARFR